MSTALPLQPVFSSMKPQVGTLFIGTPGIEQMRNYYLVQKMLEHRIRSIMTEIPFEDISRKLVENYIAPPPALTKPNDIQKFYESEAHELYASFATYEQSPDFQASLMTLVPYKGKTFSITGITSVGLQLVIDLGEG